MKADIAIVGPSESILAFRAAGVDPWEANEENALAVLKQAVKSYKIILLVDSLLGVCAEFIKKFDAQPYPVILPVPGAAGAGTAAMELIRAAGEKALGVDILFH